MVPCSRFHLVPSPGVVLTSVGPAINRRRTEEEFAWKETHNQIVRLTPWENPLQLQLTTWFPGPWSCEDVREPKTK
jgi:hypothetical protein